MDDLNSFLPDLSTPATDPQFFTAIPSDESTLDRMMSVFTSPREAMQGIELSKSASTWIVPLLVAMLLTATSFALRYYTTNAAEEEHTMRVQNFTQMSENKNLNSDQRTMFKKKAAEDTANPNKSAVWGFALGLGLVLSAPLFSSLVFFLLAKIVFKADHVTFTMILAAASITLVITGVGDVLQLVLQAITGDGAMTISPAAFVSGAPQKPLFAFAMQFNVFKIWDLIVFSIAYASLVRRQAMAGYAVVFVTWLVRIALWTGITAMLQKIQAG